MSEDARFLIMLLFVVIVPATYIALHRLLTYVLDVPPLSPMPWALRWVLVALSCALPLLLLIAVLR